MNYETQETSVTSPLLNETIENSPVKNEISVTNPLNNETSVTSPVLNETIENSPVKNEISVTNPLQNETIENSPLQNETSPVNHQVILKENNLSIPLENNTLNKPIKYKTFKIIIVYILAIICYFVPIMMLKKMYDYIDNKYHKASMRSLYFDNNIKSFLHILHSEIISKIIIWIINIISITIGLMVLIHGWVTKKYIHNFIIQSWKHWYLYIIHLILITCSPVAIDIIFNKILK